MARHTWKSGSAGLRGDRHHDSWGAEDYLGLARNRARMNAVLDRIKADAADTGQERSFLCPGFRVPPYISWKLPASARSQLYAMVVGPSGRIDTDLDRPLRIFFETGLELRIIPGAALEIRCLYHVHPWIIGRRPRGRLKRYPMRIPFEQVEETLSATILGWSEITDPQLSAHARMAGHAHRQRALSGDYAAALHIDASLTRELWIVAPELSVVVSRPKGTGLTWKVIAKGRDRIDRTDWQGIASHLDGLNINRDLRAASAWVDACHAALPPIRRGALASAAHLALVACAFAELFRPLRSAAAITWRKIAPAITGPRRGDPHPGHTD